MLVAVAVCPPAPLLIPGIAGGLLRAAGDLPSAVARAVAVLAGADRIVVLAPATPAGGGRSLAPGARLRPAVFGRSDRPLWPDLILPGGPAFDPDPPAAPSAVVGASLLQQVGIDVATEVVELVPGEAAGCADRLTTHPGRLGVLAMADGAAAHGPRAPMAEDGRAEPTDARIAAALEIGDPAALARAASQQALPAALGVAGAEVFRVLARLPRPAGAALYHHSAPFGVGYLVASWSYPVERTA